MRNKGTITTWNDAKGFGFVTPMDGGKQIFVHIKAFGNRSRRPVVDDVVTFSMARDKQGRPCAANAMLAGEKPQAKPATNRNMPAIAVALLFLGAIGVSVSTGQLPAIIGLAYAILSLVTFGAYTLDKSAAKRGNWRTAESTLHLLGLAGGWPGALIAQRMLRHKSRKESFQAVFWITVLLNGGAVVWLHTERGKVLLESLLT